MTPTTRGIPRRQYDGLEAQGCERQVICALVPISSAHLCGCALGLIFLTQKVPIILQANRFVFSCGIQLSVMLCMLLSYTF